MSFKIHLLVVSAIIIVMFGVIKVMSNKQPEPEQIAVVQVSPYKLNIERANWGLNCRNISNDKRIDNYAQSNSNTKPQENNVLDIVAQMCNGKPSCEIPLASEVLGDGPIPNCGYKMLEVEYRCFAVDRLRFVKGSDGAVVIDCDKQLSNP